MGFIQGIYCEKLKIAKISKNLHKIKLKFS